MVVHASTRISDEIEWYRRLAAYSIAVAGIMRLLGIILLLYLEIPYGGWITLLPTIVLLGLAIGVYNDVRWTRALSFLLCGLLAYQLLLQLRVLPWTSVSFSWQFVWSMILITADLTMYLLSIVFLFLLQHKKNRFSESF